MGVFMLFELKNINIRIKERTVVENFSLAVGKTDRILLLGANGSGKTTLLKYICTEFKEKCKISYLRQNDMLLPYHTVLKNLSLAGGKERAINLLNRLGLQKYENYYPYQLSGGVHRTMLILRALLFPFELLILDEPLTNLDSDTILAVCDLLESETDGRAVIITSHQNTNEFKFINKTVIV